MRLNEIENKEYMSFDEIETIVHAHCIASSKSFTTLYRGVSYAEQAFVGTIRKDRTVKDSSILEMFVFNEYMKFKDFPFRKSNTLSVTTKRDQATYYGKTICQIYPFDGSTYLYSEAISDFINFSRNIITIFHITNGTSITELHELFAEHQRFIDNMVKFQITTDPNDLSKAKGEIIIIGDKYVAVPVEQRMQARWHKVTMK